MPRWLFVALAVLSIKAQTIRFWPENLRLVVCHSERAVPFSAGQANASERPPVVPPFFEVSVAAGWLWTACMIIHWTSVRL